jgi:acylphosphatase
MSQSTDEPPVRAHILVVGRVQGVGFRAFAAQIARRRGLVGGVRNLDDGRVELDVEGGKTGIEALVRELTIGPPAARVTRIETEWGAATERHSSFSIWH